MYKEIYEVLNKVLDQNQQILDMLRTPSTLSISDKEDREKVFALMEERIKDKGYLPMWMNYKVVLEDRDEWKAAPSPKRKHYKVTKTKSKTKKKKK